MIGLTKRPPQKPGRFKTKAPGFAGGYLLAVFDLLVAVHLDAV
jgi:hypothetical protein